MRNTKPARFTKSEIANVKGVLEIRMKQRLRDWFLLLSCLASIVSPAACASGAVPDGNMTKPERKYLIEQLKSSEAGMLTAIKGLTSAQWTFKPTPESWSIQECAEHLVLAEDLIFNEAQKVLQTPAVPRLANATSQGDRQLVAEMEDRGKKAKAPKVLQPSDKFPTPESAAGEFTIRRNKTIAYVRSTHDPLRIHAGDGPTGATADVYQFFLELAAHSARHTAQMREVKSAPGYPR